VESSLFVCFRSVAVLCGEVDFLGYWVFLCCVMLLTGLGGLFWRCGEI